ncbi:MAG: BrnT family toxin [Pseudomonadales bacterium]|jgi:uncharacterized DUF497 family protein|nr:BrnT family toxin [Pseudomonadales bacterium]
MVAYDDRATPDEDRWVAVGFIGSALHVMVFAERGGRIRPISLREAESLEVRHYETHKKRCGF